MLNSSSLDVDQDVIFRFTIADYCVFGATIALSALTGLYCGCRGIFGKKGSDDIEQETAKNFIQGDKTLKPLPVAFSLVASYVSGVTILGTPSEVYLYGTQYWMIFLSILLMGVVVAYVYLPVFSVLQIHSSYEYLEIRFSKHVRTIASVMFVFDELMFLPIIIYVPALAFNQVTGVDIHVISPVVCVICIVYTIIGGLQAVVWSDTWQTTVMFCSVVVMAIVGTIYVGGITEVFNIADKGGRLKFFNLNPSVYERQSIWSVLIGGFVYWTSYNSVNQTMVQRYMSLPNLKQARVSILIYTIGITLFVSVCCYTGLLVFAAYMDCDPLSSGAIIRDDQLLPLYVMEKMGHLQGMPGLFIAGVFGAALSSLAVVLHCTSGVLLQDILRGCFGARPSDKTAAWLVRSAALILGVATIASIYIVEKLDGVLGLASSLTAISAGTTFGVFTLGVLFPWTNNKGALIGGISGAIMSGFIAFGSQAAYASGKIVAPRLPISIDGCASSLNASLDSTAHLYMARDESDIFPLYRLSYHWVSPIGVTTVLVVGNIVSLLTGRISVKTMDPELLSPVIHRFLPKECTRNMGTVRRARNKIILENDLESETERLRALDEENKLPGILLTPRLGHDKNNFPEDDYR